jgi:hypothetical protein
MDGLGSLNCGSTAPRVCAEHEPGHSAYCDDNPGYLPRIRLFTEKHDGE